MFLGIVYSVITPSSLLGDFLKQAFATSKDNRMKEKLDRAIDAPLGKRSLIERKFNQALAALCGEISPMEKPLYEAFGALAEKVSGMNIDLKTIAAPFGVDC